MEQFALQDVMEQVRMWEGDMDTFLAVTHDKLEGFYATPYPYWIMIAALCLVGFELTKKIRL
ncbi:MAG TPA: hypothetical protein VG753_01735 [Candidatus Paceibacterota bacterium]|nr:hypothetical protein [Candidatus Paceibacterota bacterium]